MSRDFVKMVLTYVLDGLGQLAATTATKIDDAGVELGRAILAEEVLFDWFFQKATAPDDGTLNLEAPSPEVLSVLAARNIDWAKFLSTAMTLIQLFRTFSGK